MANYRKMLLFYILAVVVCVLEGITPTIARVVLSESNPRRMDIGMENIFKVGPGMAVFNVATESPIDDGVICAEQREGKPFCTEVPNYMETTQLDKFSIEEFEKFKYYFKDDFVPHNNVTNRMGEEATESYFCDTKSRLIYPKVAETKESRWVMVVQHKKYRQGVLVEQCASVDKSCKYNDLLPFGIQSRCKQHYIYRSLVVVSNGVMKERMVKLPSACKCALRNVRLM
ncbi:protein spaetzle-like [Eurosta solidaginis]|uniref:protein spaetzle-like n=1 Tax=Eurosta solidaginis TaxID=178769 RepID=UPI00353110CF